MNQSLNNIETGSSGDLSWLDLSLTEVGDRSNSGRDLDTEAMFAVSGLIAECNYTHLIWC